MTKNNKWQVTGILTMTVRSKEKILALMIYPDTGVIVALETKRFEVTGDRAKDVEQVFGEHAHKVIGTAKTLPLAITQAEKYAKRWLGKKSAASARCDCSEIGI